MHLGNGIKRDTCCRCSLTKNGQNGSLMNEADLTIPLTQGRTFIAQPWIRTSGPTKWRMKLRRWWTQSRDETQAQNHQSVTLRILFDWISVQLLTDKTYVYLNPFPFYQEHKSVNRTITRCIKSRRLSQHVIPTISELHKDTIDTGF